MSDVEYHLDASTFQEPLIQLAEVLAQKVKRELPAILGAPGFVSVDLHVLIRQAMYTYNLLFYLNADERRQKDPHWRTAYGIVVLPLVRNMIDDLYNVTAILQSPATNGTRFRMSGFRAALAAFDEDEARYGGRPEWDEWIRKGRDQIDFAIRACGLKTAEVVSQPVQWPTMGKYIKDKQPGGTTTTHQDFLRRFTYGQWREYSAIAHGTFEGLLPLAMFLTSDSLPLEDRPKLEEVYPRILCLHTARAASILLCIITELQAQFHFDGASINQRIQKMWNALMQVFEVKELYNERYAQLMKDKGIDP